MHWLIVYDRRQGLLGCQEYGEAPLAERFRLEKELPDAEVVILSADSFADLLVTHGRYFLTAGELLARMTEQLRA